MINGAFHLGDEKVEISGLYPDVNGRTFEQVFNKTGVRNTYILSSEKTSFDLAKDSILELSKTINLSKIDALIVVSQTNCHTLPPVSFRLQKEFNLSKNLFLLDIQHGCSGFVYALINSLAIREALNKSNLLILTMESYSLFISDNDLTTKTLFSDAAAVLNFNDNNLPKLLNAEFYSDGNGAKDLYIKGQCTDFNPTLKMHGGSILLTVIQVLPNLCLKCLDNANLKIDDVDIFLFHQASKAVIDALVISIGLPKDKLYFDIENIGNTVSSSIPIAIMNLQSQGINLSGKKILMAGFGVGFSAAVGCFEF